MKTKVFLFLFITISNHLSATIQKENNPEMGLVGYRQDNNLTVYRLNGPDKPGYFIGPIFNQEDNPAREQAIKEMFHYLEAIYLREKKKRKLHRNIELRKESTQRSSKRERSSNY